MDRQSAELLADLSLGEVQIAVTFEALTDRELDVLRLLAQGFSNRAIAEHLVISVGTVKSHLKHIFGKLGVESRTQAVAQARAGWPAVSLPTFCATLHDTANWILS